MQPIRVILIKARGSQILIDNALFKLSRSATASSELFLLGTNIVAMIKSTLQYRKTLDSSDEVFFNEGNINDIAKYLASCSFVRVAFKSSYRQYARVTKHFRLFPDALCFVVSKKAAKDESSSEKENQTLDISTLLFSLT